MASPAVEPAAARGITLPVPYRLARRRRETHDTVTLELQPAGEAAVAGFAPGQFAMLYAFGVGEAPISVSALPHVHTVRAVGPVTAALCALRRGEQVGVRGPFGTAWPLPAAEGRDVVVVAGGIGLAPLRPVVQHVLAQRERYGRVIVIYGGRAPAELLYTAELEHWRGRFDAEVHVTVDHPADGWRGPVGIVTTLVPRAAIDPEHALVLVCGPEVMIRFAVAALGACGMPDDAIFVSLERSMRCALGHCGHCQLGPRFVCRDGPVFRWDAVEPLLRVREL